MLMLLMRAVQNVVIGLMCGALLGALVVYGAEAALHYARFGHMQEFWGEIPALSIGAPSGAIIGTVISVVLEVRSARRE